MTNATTKEKGPPKPGYKTLPSPEVKRAPSPQPEDVDQGAGTDGDIQDGIMQAYMAHMMQQMLGTGMVPPDMTQNGMGLPPQTPPGWAMEGDDNQVGALFDPQPMAMQRRRY